MGRTQHEYCPVSCIWEDFFGGSICFPLNQNPTETFVFVFPVFLNLKMSVAAFNATLMSDKKIKKTLVTELYLFHEFYQNSTRIKDTLNVTALNLCFAEH